MMNGKAAAGRSRQVDGTWLAFLAALPPVRISAPARSVVVPIRQLAHRTTPS
jgi:hypothetical protein